MKVFKTLRAASAYAAGKPIIRVGNLYLAGAIDELTEIALIAPIRALDFHSGGIAATVTAGHLNRLGNANHATAGRIMHYDAFPNCGTSFRRKSSQELGSQNLA